MFLKTAFCHPWLLTNGASDQNLSLQRPFLKFHLGYVKGNKGGPTIILARHEVKEQALTPNNLLHESDDSHQYKKVKAPCFGVRG